MMSKKIHYSETQYGFDYGSAKVTRTVSDDAKGWVVLRVTTPKEDLQVYVTKTGKIRVHDKNNHEWKPTPETQRKGER